MKEIRVTKEIGLPKEIRLTTKIISPFARFADRTSLRD
jgi:hypothetical protein